MATLGSNVVTLSDHAKRLDPNGKVDKIVEFMAQANPLLDDAAFIEGNLITGHRTTVRTGLPTVYWRQLNQGIPSSKSTTAQVDEKCGMMEAWSEVDVKLANLGGNAAAYRLSEAKAFIEAMAQEFSSTFIYGNASTSPEEFTGLATRYGDLSANNAQNIIDAGGTGSDNTSIYLVVWGDMTCHGIYPQGSKAGIEHKDHGERVSQRSTSAGGEKLLVFEDQFAMDAGLVVKDWRYVVRIANIDVSNLVANSGSQADIIDQMIKSIHRIPNLGMGKACFYANRTVLQQLDIQRKDAALGGTGIKYEEVDGKFIPVFRGIPLRTCDALLETEARVV